MSWLITGGSGQLSISIAQALEESGTSFVSLSHKELDVSIESSINQILSEKPSLIVNCAAYTAVDKAELEPNAAFSVNATGAANVALAAKELEVPLIHISTDYVFSGESQLPWRVTAATFPSTQYGASKLAGEKLIQEIHPEGSWILRTAWLYGPYGKNFAKTMIRKAITESGEVRVVDDQIGQPTSTFDLTNRIVEIGKRDIPPGVYHATNAGQTSWFEFTREIFRLSRAPLDRVLPIKSEEFVMAAKRPSYSVLDHSGWEAVGMKHLRPWEIALQDIFPAIQEQVERELSNG